ncbi:MAG: hypothetical protein U5K54_04630 [Cytophagales bacterium]|nr:hypothetical protein [Cytophagales bacterium]
MNFGYQLSGRRFSPGTITPTSSTSAFQSLAQEKMYAIDQAVYADYTQKPNDRISITYGLRLSIFQNIGKADVILYQDPRDNVNITRIDTLSYEPWETVMSYILIWSLVSSFSTSLIHSVL